LPTELAKKSFLTVEVGKIVFAMLEKILH